MRYRSANYFILIVLLFSIAFLLSCTEKECEYNAEEETLVENESSKSESEPLPITEEMKCPTCGMHTFKFTNWHTQIVYRDGTNDSFCGVKCLMAFYFNPDKYSKKNSMDFKTLYAKDYYTLEWHDMKNMHFVLGSDVLGPMGKELVPFAEKSKAEIFLDDHSGQDILTFNEITPELINELRGKKDKGL